MDFELDDINPAACVLAIIAGLFGVLLSGSMMPGNVFMMFMVFIACTVLGYIVCLKIAEG